jgi:asparagine synthase (glutamine-hydrolysing)
LCGIAGYLTFDSQQHSIRSLTESLAQIVHRGPDESGLWHDSQVALGMQRLSIIDLASGSQPIFNEDNSCCIVYNGELYNFLDLRPDLEVRGHRFRTESDTEVILHSYEEWGVDCLRHFNGMFAFAIWDARQQILLLARDRIGEKPLYYYTDSQRLIFGSEIKAILAESTVPRAINPRGLANFLAFGHAMAPETIYQNIYKLLPAHYLLVQHGQIAIKPYWDVGDEAPDGPAPQHSPAEYAEQILSLFEDSVRRRMIADVPVGAFLSGGVDSSAIVALMMRHASGPVKTFSLGFTIGGAYNELTDARQVATHFRSEHYELLAEDVDLVHTLRTLVYHYDEPFGDPAGFPVYLLSQFARQHVKVVLAGDGGDELFGGYRRYAADQAASIYQLLPRPLVQRFVPAVVDRLPRLRRIKRSVKALQNTDPARRYAAWLVYFTPQMQAELLRPDMLQALGAHDPAWVYSHYYHRMNPNTANDHLNRIMYVDLKTWLPDAFMEKVDKATMAASLEARMPFLDHRLVELAFKIPSRYKIRGWSTKRIFKQAVRSLVPEFILRKPKHGFAVPLDPWFRGSLKDFTFEILLDQRACQRGLFNMDVVTRLWREHLQGANTWDWHLWLLLNLELWFRIYLDGEAV